MNRRINLSALQSFIKNKGALRSKLQNDLAELRIVKEADLESCVYYYLRRFLRSDPRWRVLARKHVVRTGHYLDLLIFSDHTPRIAIELKWDRKEISKKDRQSLSKCIKVLRVNKAYFIATLISGNPYQKVKKHPEEKNRLFEVIVPLGLSGHALRKWKNDRERYKSKMLFGRGARKRAP